MAKTSSVERNKKREAMTKQFATRRAKLKAIIADHDSDPEARIAAVFKLSEMPRNSSPTRIRLRCELTGRPRGNYRKFKLCRVQIRELGSKGQIPGLVKSSCEENPEMMTDPLGDLLTRIRNGQLARKSKVSSPASRLRANVLEVLKREGYIRDYSSAELRPGIAELTIELKYDEGKPVIRDISRVAPGRRVYSKIKDLPRVGNGLGIAILSTPRGVMSDSEARAANVGGEVLCQVF